MPIILHKWSPDQSRLRSSLTTRQISAAMITVAIALLSMLSAAPVVADDDGWHDFNSSKYHFSIKAPGNFKEDKDSGAATFQSIYNKAVYSLVVSAYENEAHPSSSAEIKSLITKHWPEWSNQMFDSDSAKAEDVTGNGWVGVAFTATKKNLPVSGIFGGSKENMFCAFVIGNADDEDKNKFTDSFTVSGGDFSSGSSDSSATQSNNSSSGSSSNQSSSSDDSGADLRGGSDNSSSSNSSTGGWQEFKSDKYKFKILLPGVPKESHNPGNNLPEFDCKDGNSVYDVMIDPNSNSAFFDADDMKKFWKGFTESTPDVADVTDISGDDWVGKSFTVIKSGISAPCHLIIMKDGYTYVLTAYGASSDNKDKFFSSFKAHKSNAFEVGVGVIVGIAIVGFLVMVGVGVAVFFLIKRNNQKSS